MQIKRVAIAPNPRKPWAHRIAHELHKFLAMRGIAVTHARQHADLLITIGGDGTILHEREHCNLPIFGIGSKTSYVCQARKEDWKPKLAAALARPRIEKRMLLSGTLNGKRLQDAMNEIFIRNSDYRILEFDLRINGSRFKFTADGVIFSTPTGSTAYAYSAGGCELKPTASKYEVVALAPYRRVFKPLLVDASQRCTLTVHTTYPAIAVIDGQFCHGLKAGRNTLIVKKSSTSALLLQSK